MSECVTDSEGMQNRISDAYAISTTARDVYIRDVRISNTVCTREKERSF